MIGKARALWNFRRFVLNMVGREIRSRYRGSLLGATWTVLTPLATILIYLVVFAAIMAGRIPGRDDTLSYGIFLCTGIVLWSFFAEVVSRCQQIFLEYANLLKRMSFPRTSLPVIVLLTASFNFLLIFTLFMLLLLFLGRFPGSALWAFVPLVLVQQGLAVGLGVLAGTLHVFFRDVGQLLALLLHVWFWGTPIVYDLSIVPERARRVIGANPLTRLFESYQGIVLENRLPEWGTLWPAAAAAVVAVTLALFAFRQLSWEMVDEL